MPYICLARGDLPDGQLQVLDLLPNSSQRVPSLTPPGESRYVNRVKRGSASVTSAGLIDSVNYLDGLEAYLLDTVEPGGLEQAAGSITIGAGLANTDTVTINGVVFTAVAFGAENAANQTFSSVTSAGGGIPATVTSLVATINNATSVGLMKLGTILTTYAFATNASPAVTLVARKGAGATQLGWMGNITVATGGGHVTGTSITLGRLARTHEVWTPAVEIATATDIIARLDAGLSLSLSDINTILLADAGAELTNAGGSQSVGTVAGVLAVLAGRTYRAPVRDYTRRATVDATTPAVVVGDVDSSWNFRYMDSTYPTFKWHAPTTGRGGFTQMILNNGSGMSDGEIKPTTIGGDVENREVGGIRHTYNVDALTASLVSGQLQRMTNSTLLWPTSNVFPHFPFGQSGFTEYDPTTAPRLVTVYNDDGTVL